MVTYQWKGWRGGRRGRWSRHRFSYVVSLLTWKTEKTKVQKHISHNYSSPEQPADK